MNLPDKFQVFVKNHEESRKVQEKLIELGWKSQKGEKTPWYPIHNGGREDYVLVVGPKKEYLGWNSEINEEGYDYGPVVSVSRLLDEDSSPATYSYSYTEYSEEVWALAAKWIENTEYKAQMDEGRKGIILSTISKAIWKSDLEYSDLEMAEKLEPLEFLAKIRNLPEKKKLEINILPWPVIIEGEIVSIGCQTVSLEKLKEVIERICEDKNVTLNGYELNPRRNCLIVYGEKEISWEKWDEFRAELKKQEIIS